jgi:alkanesulfonate monooxygenase SsuD/methylene tetrahydromethanopterin reductase-like flavin-dependent oxidoreductase (luciferase family)
MSSLEIGIGPWAPGIEPEAERGEGFLRQAELAEELGFHSIWLPESHFDPGACPSPLLLLAAAASRTSRLGLGTTSFLLSIRHPVHVAEEVAVLDRLSGGRVLLGVGRGFRPALFSTFGVDPSEKRDRFESALDTVLQAWRGEPMGISEEGPRPRQGTPIRVSPLPIQKPHPPIWVAAFGPKALDQAGRLGLPYLSSPVEPLRRLVDNYARHRAALPSAKRREPLAIPVIRTVFVSRQRDRVEAVRAELVQQARGVAQRLGGRFSELGKSPVDEWALVGEPSRVAEGVARYRDELGLTHLIARPQVPGAEDEEIEQSIRLLSDEVRPRL